MTSFLPTLLQDLRMINRLTFFLLHGELPKGSQSVRLTYL